MNVKSYIYSLAALFALNMFVFSDLAHAALVCSTQTGLHPLQPIPGLPPPQPGWQCGPYFDQGVIVIVPGPNSVPGWVNEIQSAQTIAIQCQGAGNGYQIAACAAQQSGRLNENGQIIASCATAGNPYAIAICAAGGMTANQLSKCANGIGVAGGCFGPTNTIVELGNDAGHEVHRATNCVWRFIRGTGC